MTPPSPFEGRLREHDNDRFLTALFAPETARADLLTLYAFNLELAKIRETVSEPLIGRMRLQFWRDAISAMAGQGSIPQHEVARPLADLVVRHPELTHELSAIVDGRETDLDDLPPDNIAAFEQYAEATSSTLMAGAIRLLGGDPAHHADVLRHAGIAVAAVGAARALPFQISTGRVSVPADVCRAAGLDPTQPSQWPAGIDLRPLAAPLIVLAETQVAEVRRAVSGTPRSLLAAILPLSLAGLYLNGLKRAGGDPRAFAARPVGVARPLTVFTRAMIGRP